MARRITAQHLQGLPGLRHSTIAVFVERQPRTVREALAIPWVGRRTTRHLLELGLLTDPDGVQTGSLPVESKPRFDGEELRDWLRDSAAVMDAQSRADGWHCHSMERFVLELGRPYPSQPLTDEEAAVVEMAIESYRWGYGNFQHRECFANAQRLAAGKLVYVEGYAWTLSLYPVLHGWVTINGKVIDVTLPAENEDDLALPEPRQVRGEFENRLYFGVPFLRSYVHQRAATTGGLGSLLDDWKNEYPLLKNGGAGAV